MMGREFRENVSGTVIIKSVGGDLRLRGREDSVLILDADGGSIEQLGEGQPYVVMCDGDCRIMVPSDVAVSIQRVGGDAKITDLEGPLEVNQVGADLTARNVAAVQIRNVGGDLRVKWAEGDVTVAAVGADATIREVEGSVRVDRIGADLFLRNIDGNCVVEQVGADLLLSIAFLPGNEYRFRVGGDILCRVEPETSARFILPPHVSVGLDVEADVREEDENGRQIVTLGEGSATIYIDNAAELRLVGEGEDYMLNLSVQIEEELEARMSMLEEKLSQQLEGLDERIRSHTEHWTAQAERLSERAQRQAERTAERLRRTMERKKEKRKGRPITTGHVHWGAPPMPPRPPLDPVTEQERLMILKMVQEGKITIDEAERLLAALEP